MRRSRSGGKYTKIQSTCFARMCFPFCVLLWDQGIKRSSLVKHLTGIIDHCHMLWFTPLCNILFYFTERKFLHTSEGKILSHQVLPSKDRKQISRILSLSTELLHQCFSFEFEHCCIYLLYHTPRNTFLWSHHSVRKSNIKTTFARVCFNASLQHKKTSLMLQQLVYNVMLSKVSKDIRVAPVGCFDSESHA